MPVEMRRLSENEWLAELLDGRRFEFIDRYKSTLTATHSHIVRDESSLGQAVENAAQILTDVSESIRFSGRRVGCRFSLDLSDSHGFFVTVSSTKDR